MDDFCPKTDKHIFWVNPQIHYLGHPRVHKCSGSKYNFCNMLKNEIFGQKSKFPSEHWLT